MAGGRPDPTDRFLASGTNLGALAMQAWRQAGPDLTGFWLPAQTLRLGDTGMAAGRTRLTAFGNPPAVNLIKNGRFSKSLQRSVRVGVEVRHQTQNKPLKTKNQEDAGQMCRNLDESEPNPAC